MWNSRYKRILLWHTARNILAIFYMCQIGFVYSCGTVFEDIQSKAILSQIVIVGRINKLNSTLSDQSPDYQGYVGSVQVLSVLKQPETQQKDDLIYRKQHIEVAGFLPNSERSPAQHHLSTTSIAPSSTNQSCLSYVNLTQDYILFINRTAGASQERPTYHTAQVLSDYTKSDKKRIKDVLCDDCARAPNAKSKRNLQIDKGASNYKINCRVEGNPPPDVRWYRDGKELDDSFRGIAIKHKRRKSLHTATIRIKLVKSEHAATYKCVAKNVLGEDTAKTRLTVMPNFEPMTTPPPPVIEGLATLDVGDDLVTVAPASHYIPCTGKDRNFCLHDGECNIYPDGRYKHCRCMARFTGARCEEANIIPPGHLASSPVPESVELVSVVTALAAVLAILVILLLILAFYCGGWKYRRNEDRRRERYRQYISGRQQPEVTCLLEGNDSNFKHQSITQCHTTASQTEPVESSLQQLRRSLNLEHHYPHSSSDVVLRRKSNGGASGRPASQPVDRRLTRSRLSGTSTLTESKRENDSEFDVLQERTPSSASLELDMTRSASSCGDNSHAHNNCDQDSAEVNILHISESTLDSSECNKQRAGVSPDKYQPLSQLPNDPPITDNNANAKKYAYHQYNGDV